MGCRSLLLALGIGFLPLFSTNAKPQADINCAADIAGCCCRGDRGNVDCDFNDMVDIVDLTLLIDHLYLTLEPLPSNDEANTDGEGTIDISDLTRLIDHLFISQRSLPDCPRFVNHAPRTRIPWMDSLSQPFINTAVPNLVDSGVLRAWTADDKIDHPYEPQPFSYQWRLYGPYDSSTVNSIFTQFRKIVFVTTEDEILALGQAKYIPFCDTVWSVTPPYVRVTCDTMFVDTVSSPNRFGALDTILEVESLEFNGNPSYNRIVIQSGANGDSTTDSTSTYLYDFFRGIQNDRTTLGYFLFWVRAIDHDFPPKADPAPPFQKISVIDAKHENELLIADAQISYYINARKLASAQAFWSSAVDRWRPGSPYTYHVISQPNGNALSLTVLLSHKVVVVVSDDVIKGVVNTPDIRKRLIQASKTGTQIWMCGRAQIGGDEGKPPRYLSGAELYQIGDWFGLSAYPYSGWDWYYLQEPSVRIEDFIGASPTNPAWPVLAVDSSFLHSRYYWDFEIWLPFVDSLAALPEVAAFAPSVDAEVLYTYNSLYTEHHPILADTFFFAGKPVVYRLNRDNHRLFVSSFTPYSLAGDSVGGAAQILVDSALNWLYEPFEISTPAQRGEVKP